MDEMWLREAPDREALLAKSHDDPSRRLAVIQRANWLVQATDNERFRESRDVKHLQWKPRNNGVYSSYDLNFVFNKFTQAKKMWDESKDCDELKHTIETLVDAGKLQNVKKIACFGLGQFFHDIKGELRDHRLTSQSWRCMGQHAAALTIANVLHSKQGGEKVALFAQDPAYFEHDKAVLRHFGFKIMDGSHGVQEGFVEVDERTFVMCVNFGDRVQQVVCETSRPAAMIDAGHLGELVSGPEARKTSDVQTDHHVHDLTKEEKDHWCQVVCAGGEMPLRRHRVLSVSSLYVLREP
ncbi:hypothetical protein UCREL1_5698 [Eutypa lata UCREL1]|uniref:SRR1-like domain-containing protein n=1 Tax=Eutypa lata (strain UCR-EL1) TaxID=1287681 RepID=M7TKQ3_EUTLA|nr:hypothetical protein UCREL1_5698 [Eutypa lata UCREL1]